MAMALCAAFFTLAANAEEPAPLAVINLGFELTDSSLDGAGEEEQRRLQKLTAILGEMIHKSPRFATVSIPPALAKKIADARPFAECGGCDIVLARETGARYVTFGVVQKVSNLILNITVLLRDIRTGEYLSTESVDIRGNTDRSWTGGLRWLAQYRLGLPDINAEK